MTMTKPKRQPASANEGTEAPEEPSVETAAPEEQAPPAEAPKAPRGHAITIDKFVVITRTDSKAALINSFAVCEKLTRGASIKRTSDEWRVAFDAWCREPRI